MERLAASRRSRWAIGYNRPIASIYRLIAQARRLGYRRGLFHVYEASLPVIAIGNITLDIPEKVPFLVWIARTLRRAGYKPGIVGSGHGGDAKHWPQQVRADSDPYAVGSEAVVLAKRTGCPVVVAPRRLDGVFAMLEYADCDIILADDSLLYYPLFRDLEIVVVDGIRRFGNGYVLPAGPLLEPEDRLASADFVVTNGVPARNEFEIKLTPGRLRRLHDGAVLKLEDLAQRRVHLLSGAAAFKGLSFSLRQLGAHVASYPNDSDPLKIAGRVRSTADDIVVMTDVSAIKFKAQAGDYVAYLEIEAEPDERFETDFLDQLSKAAARKKVKEDAVRTDADCAHA